MNDNTQKIISLYDGSRSSTDIADIVGLSPRYVRKVATRHNLDRLRCGAQRGKKNHQFVAGRRIDRDGYVLISVPVEHPHARQRSQRKGKLMYEHRLIMEQKLGRYLMANEVVHHIDELKLHNHPMNLSLFPENGEHLISHVKGKKKKISVRGLANIKAKTALSEDFERIDIYRLRRARGEIRLKEILLAGLSLGIDSLYLSGTHLHLKKAGIDYSSRSKIEHALDQLYQRWEADLVR
jgi:hypothetical protein